MLSSRSSFPFSARSSASTKRSSEKRTASESECGAQTAERVANGPGNGNGHDVSAPTSRSPLEGKESDMQTDKTDHPHQTAQSPSAALPLPAPQQPPLHCIVKVCTEFSLSFDSTHSSFVSILMRARL